MASVDDIFKSSGYSGKRKLDPLRDPDEIYKSAKLTSNGSSRHPQDGEVVDSASGAGPAPPTDDNEEDYGPELPPDDDEEEGRFFGGGISQKESEILDYVNDADDVKAERFDMAWLRRTALNFEKNISKNAELRAKFEDEPHKFIGSEADLDAEIKSLSVLSEHPELYTEFIKLGCLDSLIGLLSHENTDIVIDVLEILGELTDEDVDAEEEQWDGLADALMEFDLPDLLASNLERLNEDDESDRNGVYYALGIVENLCSRSAIATKIGQEGKLLKFLLKRIQREESPLSQNKQYAAEILAIIAQASPANRRELASLDVVDTILQLVALYRNQDPDKGSEEEEYMENLFEALTCVVDGPEGKDKFVDAEGIELCIIMLKEGKKSKPPALRLLDHAVGGPSGNQICQKLVSAGGLKGIFTLFGKTSDQRLIEHLLAIFASLLRWLPADSAERIRTLAKFVEKDYEKIGKLVKLRGEYGSRIYRAEQQAAQPMSRSSEEAKADLEMELFSQRIDAGLLTLQTLDVILAWLVAEDGGAKQRIKKLLAGRDEDLSAVKVTIEEQIQALDTSLEENKDTKDMLSTLVEFLV